MYLNNSYPSNPLLPPMLNDEQINSTVIIRLERNYIHVSDITFTRDTLKAPVDWNTHRFNLLTIYITYHRPQHL